MFARLLCRFVVPGLLLVCDAVSLLIVLVIVFLLVWFSFVVNLLTLFVVIDVCGSLWYC